MSSECTYNELKTNLRLSIDRMKLLLKEKSEFVNKSRRKIAHYLANGKIKRAKMCAEHIIREQCVVEVMEATEMYCECLLDRFDLLQQVKTLDKYFAQVISFLIWVAPCIQTDVAELKFVTDKLAVKYGKQYAPANALDYVEEKEVHKLSFQTLPKILAEKYLFDNNEESCNEEDSGHDAINNDEGSDEDDNVKKNFKPKVNVSQSVSLKKYLFKELIEKLRDLEKVIDEDPYFDSDDKVLLILGLIFRIGRNNFDCTEEEEKIIGPLLAKAIQPIQICVKHIAFIYRTRLDNAILQRRSAIQFLIDYFGKFPVKDTDLLSELQKHNIKKTAANLDVVIEYFSAFVDSDEGESDYESHGGCDVPNSHVWWPVTK